MALFSFLIYVHVFCMVSLLVEAKLLIFLFTRVKNKLRFTLFKVDFYHQYLAPCKNYRSFQLTD